MNFIKLPLLSLGFVMMATAVNAGEIQEGAVVCITQKYLEKYEAFVADEAEDFVDEMFKRAQCVTKKKQSTAYKVAEVGSHVQVEVVEGFKLWLNKDGFQE